MPKFNTKAVDHKKTVNKAGGESFKQSPELNLVSLVLSTFVNKEFYRDENKTLEEMRNLISKVDPMFAAQVGVFARNEFGMRSITHALSSDLAKSISGEPWAQEFYRQVIFRPDDITETIAYHLAINGKIPNSMKKGFAAAFNKFDAYQIAKYRGEGKAVKLIDAVNLVHPVPTAKNKEALEKLVAGTLRSTETWEAKMTKAGQTATSDKEKSEKKAEAWQDLLAKNKLGYFALLRNLRNISQDAPDIVDLATQRLVDAKAINNSKVLPFRFLSAMDAIAGTVHERKLTKAISDAVEISLSNMPELSGKTLVAVDVSGSMTFNKAGDRIAAEIAALFGAAIFKSNDSDLLVFDGHATYAQLNPNDSLTTMVRSMDFRGGATDFNSIFNTANKAYDRVFILSDMEAWVGYHTPKQSFSNYKRKYNCDPKIYTIDLAGNGTMQFPERNVFAMAGFSEKIFDAIAPMELDPKALINKIKEIKFI